jgi:Flp pilus assembly protein TadB
MQNLSRPLCLAAGLPLVVVVFHAAALPIMAALAVTLLLIFAVIVCPSIWSRKRSRRQQAYKVLDRVLTFIQDVLRKRDP